MKSLENFVVIIESFCWKFSNRYPLKVGLAFIVINMLGAIRRCL